MTDRDDALGRAPLEEQPEVAAAIEDDTTVPSLVTAPDDDQSGPDFQSPGGPGGPPRVRTGADQPWDPEDLAMAKGGDGTPEQVDLARQELERDGAAAIERTVP
ncbi:MULTISPECIES: hypothetical protein [unclassified Solwaraspora]|uniref:hypothetical protein n=1 Tax=unclassified Solwaraspora TaxID=2627926 RepID=UPI00259BEB6D|nr:hypothetical protein [Solwaraspora sp. WMMA2056]WJK40218.1 hypothetical protein O7608_28025 [Solwaraspora sp. WMMA2056]